MPPGPDTPITPDAPAIPETRAMSRALRAEEPTEALLGGRYQVGECIGEGGMARVHRGVDQALGRPVAIKIMRAGVEDASELVRARGEMMVLASLSHPSLVTLYDARIAPGETSYLVMELVDGPTLSGWLEKGALEERDVAQLGLDLAEALHVVHSAGVVHRDIKPSNVLLAPTDLPGRTYHARLADFGIAYLVDSTRLTTPGLVVGTVAYLAPEQVKGAAPAPPADIYALGLLLIEALTGQRAFASSGRIESLVARVSTPPSIPDSVRPEWMQLLRRMTALDPADRPSAREVVEAASDLLATARGSRAVAAAAPVLAAPAPTEVFAALFTDSEEATQAIAAEPAPAAAAVTPLYGADRPRRRRGLLIGAVGLAGAAALAGGIWLTGGGAGVPAPAESATVTEPSLNPSAPTTVETAAPQPAIEPVVAPQETSDAPVDDEPDVAPSQPTQPSQPVQPVQPTQPSQPAPAPAQPQAPAKPPAQEAPKGGTGGQPAPNPVQQVDKAAEAAAEEARKAAEELKKQQEKLKKEQEKLDKKG